MFEDLTTDIWFQNPAVEILISGILPRAANLYPGATNNVGHLDLLNQRALQVNRGLHARQQRQLQFIGHPKFAVDGRIQRHLLNRDGIHLSRRGTATLVEDIERGIRGTSPTPPSQHPTSPTPPVTRLIKESRRLFRRVTMHPFLPVFLLELPLILSLVTLLLPLVLLSHPSSPTSSRPSSSLLLYSSYTFSSCFILSYFLSSFFFPSYFTSPHVFRSS